MMVNDKNTVVAKDNVILPGDHLSKAQYTDVIERQMLDGNSEDEKVRMCVSSNVELEKCKTMRDVAFSRDIRPIIECVLKDKETCVRALNEHTIDVIVVQPKSFEALDLQNAKAILFESFDDNVDKYVVMADDGMGSAEIRKAEL
jgi:Transferrin